MQGETEENAVSDTSTRNALLKAEPAKSIFVGNKEYVTNLRTEVIPRVTIINKFREPECEEELQDQLRDNMP